MDEKIKAAKTEMTENAPKKAAKIKSDKDKTPLQISSLQPTFIQDKKEENPASDETVIPRH